MNTSALIMMITVESIVILLTGFFFYKVLITKSKEDGEFEDL